MKLSTLNAKGIAHLLTLLLIVVGVAIAGSFALVMSHAQSCTPVSGVVSGAVSSPVSSPCAPASSPTSSPTLAKGGPCYLGTTGPNGYIVVLNRDGASGNCAQYSDSSIYYSGISGKNVRCTRTTKIHNNVYVCLKVG